MAKFIRKNVTAEAVQWNGQNVDEIREICPRHITNDGYQIESFYPIGTYTIDYGEPACGDSTLWLKELHRWKVISVDMWVVNENDRLSVYSDVQFKQFFETPR